MHKDSPLGKMMETVLLKGYEDQDSTTQYTESGCWHLASAVFVTGRPALFVLGTNGKRLNYGLQAGAALWQEYCQVDDPQILIRKIQVMPLPA